MKKNERRARHAHLVGAASTLVLVGLAGCGILDPSGGDGGTHDGGTNDGGGGSVLPLNCATPSNETNPRCQSPAGAESGSIGTGPSVSGPGFPELHGGFVDGNRVIAAVELGADNSLEEGVVMAVDLQSGNRAALSGKYEDASSGAMTVGSGPDWGQPQDVQPGPDGWYVLSKHGVYRMDPASGNRTQVFDRDMDPSPCMLGSTPLPAGSLNIASLAVSSTDGTVYLSYENRDLGVGVVGLHGGQCTVLTASGSTNGFTRGAGPTYSGGVFRSLRFHDGAVWTVEFSTASLLRIDASTGDRRRVSSSSSSAMVGTGDGPIGDGYIGFGANNTIWVSSYDGSSDTVYLVTVDPNTGNRTNHPTTSGPVRRGVDDHPPLWVHPSAPLLILGLNNAFILYDPASGDSNILST